MTYGDDARGRHARIQASPLVDRRLGASFSSSLLLLLSLAPLSLDHHSQKSATLPPQPPSSFPSLSLTPTLPPSLKPSLHPSTPPNPQDG